MSKQENPQAADTAIPDHIDPTVARQYPSLAESTVSREVVYEGALPEGPQGRGPHA